MEEVAKLGGAMNNDRIDGTQMMARHRGVK